MMHKLRPQSGYHMISQWGHASRHTLYQNVPKVFNMFQPPRHHDAPTAWVLPRNFPSALLLFGVGVRCPSRGWYLAEMRAWVTKKKKQTDIRRHASYNLAKSGKTLQPLMHLINPAVLCIYIYTLYDIYIYIQCTLYGYVYIRVYIYIYMCVYVYHLKFISCYIMLYLNHQPQVSQSLGCWSP